MEIQTIIYVLIFLLAVLFCYLYYLVKQNNKLKEKHGSIYDKRDLGKFFKKGLYLKLVTRISKVDFEFETEKLVSVFGFELMTMDDHSEIKSVQKLYSKKPIKAKIFFELSKQFFESYEPQMNYIYKVVKVNEVNGIPVYKFRVEKQPVKVVQSISTKPS